MPPVAVGWYQVRKTRRGPEYWQHWGGNGWSGIVDQFATPDDDGSSRGHLRHWAPLIWRGRTAP